MIRSKVVRLFMFVCICPFTPGTPCPEPPNLPSEESFSRPVAARDFQPSAPEMPEELRACSLPRLLLGRRRCRGGRDRRPRRVGGGGVGGGRGRGAGSLCRRLSGRRLYYGRLLCSVV